MIYKTRTFCALTKKESLSDEDLIQACQEMAQGLVDADLGSGLYKKRVAATGKGKSGGYRTLIGAVIGKRYFFLYAFAKSARANINSKEKLALRELAREFNGFDQKTLQSLVEQGELIEVGKCDE